MLLRGRPSLFVLLLLPAFILGTVVAHSEDCGLLLSPDVSLLQVDDLARMSYLMQLDKDSYEKHKKELSVAGIPVDGTPISALLGYESFDTMRLHERQHREFTYDRSHSQWSYVTSIPPDRSAAFLDCMNAKPLKFHVQHVSDETVVLEMTWTPQMSTKEARVKYTILNGRAVDPPKTVPVNGTRPLTVVRDKGKELVITADARQGAAATFVVPAPIQILRTERLTRMSSEAYCPVHAGQDEYCAARFLVSLAANERLGKYLTTFVTRIDNLDPSPPYHLGAVGIKNELPPIGEVHQTIQLRGTRASTAGGNLYAEASVEVLREEKR